jgi:hypothetical protein
MMMMMMMMTIITINSPFFNICYGLSRLASFDKTSKKIRPHIRKSPWTGNPEANTAHSSHLSYGFFSLTAQLDDYRLGNTDKTLGVTK